MLSKLNYVFIFSGHFRFSHVFVICVNVLQNNTNALFISREVLGLSSGIGDIGSLRWDLALYLLILWVGVYFSTFKGVKLTAKVRRIKKI